MLNNEICKYMRIGNSKRLIPFSPEIPDIKDGNVKVKYYLTKNIETLDNEFVNNDNIISVDLSKMNIENLLSMNNAFKNCKNLKEIDLGAIKDIPFEDSFINLPEYVDIDGDEDFVNKIYDEMHITKYVVDNIDDLIKYLAINEDSTIILNADLEVLESMPIRGNKIFDLNGHSITNVRQDVVGETKYVLYMLDVQANAILTIKDSVGTGKVDAGDRCNYAQTCIISRTHAVVNIEGGYFTSGYDYTGADRNDTIYTTGGVLNISGGKFESTFPWGKKKPRTNVHFCINAQDGKDTVENPLVFITGGEFVDMDPSNNLTDPEPVTWWVQDGYSVTSENDGEHIIYKVINN